MSLDTKEAQAERNFNEILKRQAPQDTIETREQNKNFIKMNKQEQGGRDMQTIKRDEREKSN